jgi:uncharacterized phiE125 gp8 family phage protein
VRFLDLHVVTPATGSVVTLDEFVDHARLNALTVGRQPELLERELEAATERCEKYLRRSLLEQTLRALFVTEVPAIPLMILPRGPVKEIKKITSRGQVVDPASYKLEWSTVILQSPLATATVEYVSLGYGTQGTAVPAAIREGILEYATTLYDDREGARPQKYEASSDRTIPRGVQDLWRPYQIEVSG